MLNPFFSIAGFVALVFCAITLTFNAFAQASKQNSTEQAPSNAESTAQNSNYSYISDDLYTYLRAGPSSEYRLLGSVTAGERVEVLQMNEQAGYAEIIDSRQRTGWVEIKFVSEQASIRDKYSEAQIALTEKTRELSNMQAEVKAMKKNISKSNRLKSSLNRRVTQQLEEIASLNERIEMQERGTNMQWFTRGAILAMVALVIGYIMGLTGRKNKASNRIL